MFPYPNWLQNHYSSAAFPPCAVQKNDSFSRLSGKWPSWEAQFHITIDFACILDRIFIISRLILLQFVKKRFPSSLRNIAPSGRPSPPGMRHVLAPSHMPIHTLQKSMRTIPLQRLFFRRRLSCLLGGPLDHGVFKLRRKLLFVFRFLNL